MINVAQITSQLAKMPDHALQQYAAMHKNDPYTMALALAESNRRKEIRGASQGMGAMPQPKVVDQEIAGMAQQMPEDTGIGQLPAPNMQGMAEGGIVAFEGGGEVPGYAGGVFTKEDPKQAFAQKYHDAAVYAGEQLGVDPGIIISQWGLETGWGKKIIPGTNNLGNIKDFSGKGVPAYDKAEKSTSKYRAYDSPEAFADDYVKLIKNKYPDSVGVGGDAKKFVTGLRPGEPGGYATDKNYASKFLGAISAPVAQATPAPGITALPSDVSSQIPGQTRQAPAAKPEDTSFLSPGWFEQKAEDLGMSRDVGRQAFNTTMAPTPAAPVTTLPKAGGMFSGLAGLGEKLYNKVVPAAGMSEKQVAALRAETEAARAAEAARAGQLPLRLTPPSAPIPSGTPTIPVTPGGQGVVQSAAELERLRGANQAADQLAATQAAARTATEAAGLPSAAERLQQASYLRESDEAARLMNRARAATNAKTAAQTGEGIAALTAPTEAPEEPKGGMPDLNQAFRRFELDQQNKAEDVQVAKPEAAPEVAEAAPEAKKDGMDWNDFMIKMGLSLMASKEPNALTGVGQSGLNVLAMQQAEAKHKAELEAKQSEADYRKSMGKYYDAYGAAIERGAKEKNNVSLAEKAAQDAVDTWAKNNKMALLQSPGLYDQMRDKYRMEAYKSFGIEPTMSASAPDATGGGFKLLGVRPS